MSDEQQINKPAIQSSIVEFQELPTNGTLEELIQFAQSRGLEVFQGRQFNIDGEIHPEQLDRLTQTLDSEISLVKLDVGTRVLAVGNNREYAPLLKSFADRGSEVVCHLHTHVPELTGKSETLKKGPSTSDLRISENINLPLYLRTDGKTYRYKIAQSDEGVTIHELEKEFYGNPEEWIKESLENPESNIYSDFYTFLRGLKGEISETDQIETLKKKYTRELTIKLLTNRILESTVEESADFASFIVERMSSDTFQEENPGSYIQEIDQEEFNKIFNPPTIYMEARQKLD